jgi:hypothetical protein
MPENSRYFAERYYLNVRPLGRMIGSLRYSESPVMSVSDTLVLGLSVRLLLLALPVRVELEGRSVVFNAQELSDLTLVIFRVVPWIP